MRAWSNGSLISAHAPAISVLDHGFTVGDGVFEAIKVVDTVPFALRRHLDRLARSAAGLGLPPPDEPLVREAIREVLAGQEIGLGRIRLTYTAGPSPLGSGRDTTVPSLVVVVTESTPYPETTTAVVVPWPRNERGATAGLKSTSYAENVIALAYAESHGASEAVFANTVGNLCEGTGTNVFCVFGDTVVTPPLSAGCLRGVTRDLLIEWCGIEERDISLEELASADEVFLTSTTRDVQGLSALDERVFPTQTVTKRLAQEWRDREVLDVDP